MRENFTWSWDTRRNRRRLRWGRPRWRRSRDAPWSGNQGSHCTRACLLWWPSWHEYVRLYILRTSMNSDGLFPLQPAQSSCLALQHRTDVTCATIARVDVGSWAGVAFTYISSPCTVRIAYWKEERRNSSALSLSVEFLLLLYNIRTLVKSDALCCQTKLWPVC